MLVEVVSLMIRVLSAITKSLKRSLEELEAKIAPGLSRKSAVLETAKYEE